MFPILLPMKENKFKTLDPVTVCVKCGINNIRVMFSEFSLFGFACLLVMSFSKHVRFSWTNSQEVVSGKRGWVNSSLKWRESETNSYLSIRSYIYKSRSSSSHPRTSISIKHPRDSKIQWAMHLPLKFGPYQRYVMWFKISKRKCLFDQNTKAVNGLYVLTVFFILIRDAQI